jgi:hypothetical protein
MSLVRHDHQAQGDGAHGDEGQQGVVLDRLQQGRAAEAADHGEHHVEGGQLAGLFRRDVEDAGLLQEQQQVQRDRHLGADIEEDADRAQIGPLRGQGGEGIDQVAGLRRGVGDLLADQEDQQDEQGQATPMAK